ncbi:MAG TPA: hypothetical protein VFU13_22305 [Steroidobacteraceae bacterium]|nr:hypothetical protein [Steroidobacteraceae bacterium]
MNSKSLVGPLALAVLGALLGCSTSKTAPTVQAPHPALEWRNSQLIPPLPAMEPPGQFCLLGTTCLAMDPRPFELCLLSSRDCLDKAAEPMQVAPPRWFTPAPGVQPLQVSAPFSSE